MPAGAGVAGAAARAAERQRGQQGLTHPGALSPSPACWPPCTHPRPHPPSPTRVAVLQQGPDALVQEGHVQRGRRHLHQVHVVQLQPRQLPVNPAAAAHAWRGGMARSGLARGRARHAQRAGRRAGRSSAAQAAAATPVRVVGVVPPAVGQLCRHQLVAAHALHGEGGGGRGEVGNGGDGRPAANCPGRQRTIARGCAARQHC